MPCWAMLSWVDGAMGGNSDPRGPERRRALGKSDRANPRRSGKVEPVLHRGESYPVRDGHRLAFAQVIEALDRIPKTFGSVSAGISRNTSRSTEDAHGARWRRRMVDI
jgi:hypothetical protein